MTSTWAERRSAGRELRRTVPRSAHAEWTPPPDRPDPVDLLEAQGRTRVQSLLPIRYGRMAESPFAFYRGGAAVMARDLAGLPVTGLRVQACGDAHVSNFGKFATPERNMVFDINDFDETLPGPWEWDVKRLAASLQVVGRQRGFARSDCDRVVATAVRSYREHMAQAATMRTLERWSARLDVADVLSHFPSRYRPTIARDVEKAQGKDHQRAVAKLTDSRRRRGAVRRGSAARRAHRQHRPRHGRRRADDRRVPRDAWRTTCGTCSTGSASPTSPARSWGWGASALGVGSACSKARTFPAATT